MKLRLATLADQAEIARLHCDSWHEAFMSINPDLVKARGDDYPRRYQTWGKILQDEQFSTHVAVDKSGQIVGVGQGGTVREELGVPEYDGELVRLYIAPDNKGQGVGKKLINIVASTLKSQDKQSMIVVAWSINVPARAVYEHLGAKFIKEIVQEKDGFDNSQAVYGWQDIDTIIEASA